MRNSEYQVAYLGQIITNPLDLETALKVAAAENADALCAGDRPLAEVVLAPETPGMDWREEEELAYDAAREYGIEDNEYPVNWE